MAKVLDMGTFMMVLYPLNSLGLKNGAVYIEMVGCVTQILPKLSLEGRFIIGYGFVISLQYLSIITAY